MQVIKYLKPYNGKNAGDVDTVSTNVAFGLVEKGIAVRLKEVESNKNIEDIASDKMMRTEETFPKKRGRKPNKYFVK